ncbi:MAG: molybdopterin biosynthesis protein, partial [Desulfobacteraceae bacterium]
MKRSVYLSMKSLDEARDIFLGSLGKGYLTGTEIIGIDEALGRVTAEPVFAKYSSPSYHSAAMDGVAVRAEETYGTTERRPRKLRIKKDFVWVNTGQPMPESFDAVIIVEKVHQINPEE